MGHKNPQGRPGVKIIDPALGAQTDGSGSTPREDASVIGQSAHLAEIPGPQAGEPGPSQSVSQSNKYLKTGPKTRRPAGLAAGARDRPRWLRGLGRHFGRAEGGARPEQNRRWMERGRYRRVRRKLPSTPNTRKIKPGQAPAGPASACPAGRTRARGRAGSEWECHVEIEWIGAQGLTPHCGGLRAGRGGGRGPGRYRWAEQQGMYSRGGAKRKCGVGWACNRD